VSEGYSFRVLSEGSTAVFAPQGRLAYPCVVGMRLPVFAFLAERRPNVIADFSSVEYMDLTGARLVSEMGRFLGDLGRTLVVSSVRDDRSAALLKSADPDRSILFFDDVDQASAFLLRFAGR